MLVIKGNTVASDEGKMNTAKASARLGYAGLCKTNFMTVVSQCRTRIPAFILFGWFRFSNQTADVVSVDGWKL